MSLDKVKVLLHQDRIDLENLCYDKCVSASYFSCRMAAELFLKSRGIEYLPRRDDKLINLLKNQGFKEEAEELLLLYNLRKKADYSRELVERNEAITALKTAEKLLSILVGRIDVAT
jgi:uncharacterized protein (UPF0332 family)